MSRAQTISKALPWLAIATALSLAGCGEKKPAPDAASPPADTGATASAASASGDTKAKHIDAPKRNPGWWEFADVAPNGDELSKTKLCVGEASEKVYSAFDQISGSMCTSKTFEKAGDGWTYTTVCGVPDMKPTTTKGKITGDISTGYTMDEVLDISVEGDNVKRVAKLVSPTCPDGFKEGDEVIMSGMKHSVLFGR